MVVLSRSWTTNVQSTRQIGPGPFSFGRNNGEAESEISALRVLDLFHGVPYKKTAIAQKKLLQP